MLPSHSRSVYFPIHITVAVLLLFRRTESVSATGYLTGSVLLAGFNRGATISTEGLATTREREKKSVLSEIKCPLSDAPSVLVVYLSATPLFFRRPSLLPLRLPKRLYSSQSGWSVAVVRVRAVSLFVFFSFIIPRSETFTFAQSRFFRFLEWRRSESVFPRLR